MKPKDSITSVAWASFDTEEHWIKSDDVEIDQMRISVANLFRIYPPFELEAAGSLRSWGQFRGVLDIQSCLKSNGIFTLKIEEDYLGPSFFRHIFQMGGSTTKRNNPIICKKPSRWLMRESLMAMAMVIPQVFLKRPSVTARTLLAEHLDASCFNIACFYQ